MFSAADHGYMARALRLAERGLYTTSPNPRVGCVLVRDGRIVGEGWHARAGEAHAEVNALRAAGDAARGATAYVTLEPCAHHGRTPPCVDALIAAGIGRVVAALEDPNPRVAGRGLEQLRAAGIPATCGLLSTDAAALNVGFIARMTRGRPWLRMKMAASLDGRTALDNGLSQWLTGPAARRDGHRWRARACALMTGSGTVREDDPQFTVRDIDIDIDRHPLRVVVDSRLEIAPTARILAGGGALVACATADAGKVAALRAQGAEVLALPEGTGRVDLPALLAELGRRGVNEVHAEAGSGLSGALLHAGLVDELLLYLAPCLLGDSARGMFALPVLSTLEGRVQLCIDEVRMLGSDLRLRARLLPNGGDASRA